MKSAILIICNIATYFFLVIKDYRVQLNYLNLMRVLSL